MKHRCCYNQCGRETDRIVFVANVEGFWPVCGACGRKMIRALNAMYPGRALHTRGRNTQ